MTTTEQYQDDHCDGYAETPCDTCGLHTTLAAWQEATPALREVARAFHSSLKREPYMVAKAFAVGGGARADWEDVCGVLNIDPDSCEAVGQEVT